MDSGASKHICSNSGAFVDMKSLQHSNVTLPNNAVIPVKVFGDVRVSTHILLKDTLFVPQFNFNLLSVSALTNDFRFMIHFYHARFEIQETSTKKMIGKGNKIGGLYILHTDTVDVVNKVSAHV